MRFALKSRGDPLPPANIPVALPPGKVSVEHVINVLGRLNAVPTPPTAATQLQVSTPPLANTARYDSLRADSADSATDGIAQEAGHDAA